jgi:multicomponent Na+:H+ antiporter subunit E
MHRVVTLAWLTLVWVMLWEEFTWANVLGGLLAAVAVVRFIPSHRLEVRVGFRPLAAVRLLVVFLWEMVKASAKLTWEIYTPRNTVNPAVVAVPLRCRVPGVITVVANMVSLTPGSVTLEIDEESTTLYMHVLHLTTMEEARYSVLRMEELVLAAFPPDRRAMLDERELPT